MFNFPNTPALGDLYQPINGPVYTWDGQKWAMTGSPLQVTPAYSNRNRVVNGAMQISQENGNTAGTGFLYAADQWNTLYVTSAGTFTSQRVQSVTPNGSRNRFRITITVADASLAAGEYLSWRQAIEGIRIADFGYGLASAKQSVLRFGFKGPAGTYSAAIRNSAGDRAYIALFTITAGQANTDTAQTFIIPGDTTGTWLADTVVGIDLWIALACGATLQGTSGWQGGNIIGTSANSNGMATAGAVFELFDVGLYLDPNATGVPPPWQLPDEAAELQACMRYWRPIPQLIGKYISATIVALYGWFSPLMRTDPAVSLITTANAINEVGVSGRTITGVVSLGAFAGGDVVCQVNATGTAPNMATSSSNTRVFVANARM